VISEVVIFMGKTDRTGERQRLHRIFLFVRWPGKDWG
jgi:hypothetical protein